MYCKSCRSTPQDCDQSMTACIYCDEDLSGEKDGTNICKSCANIRQFCQGCGQPLRLGDFTGVFVKTGGGKVNRTDEKKIIAVILKSQTLSSDQ